MIPIVLSKHSIQSLRNRMGCSPRKFLKVARKAWRSTERIKDGEIPNKRKYEYEIYPGHKPEYRKMMGYIFVFGIEPKAIVLVTMFPPNY